jgi:hypothetical protein
MNLILIFLLKYIFPNLNQALDGALKQVRSICADTSAILFSVDAAAGKIVCLSAVPPVSLIFSMIKPYSYLSIGSLV